MTTATVPSRTTPGISYAVTINDDGSTACSCPAGAHGRHCWHVAAVRLADSHDAIEAEFDAAYPYTLCPMSRWRVRPTVGRFASIDDAVAFRNQFHLHASVDRVS